MTEPPTIADLQRVVAGNRDLGVFGWIERRRREEEAEYEIRRTKAQSELLDCFDEFAEAVRFLRECPSSSRGRSSYGLKHVAEAVSPLRYIANGPLLAAALFLGLRMERYPGSPNSTIFISAAWAEGSNAREVIKHFWRRVEISRPAPKRKVASKQSEQRPVVR